MSPRVFVAFALASLMLALAVPAQAANSQSFSDPAGDSGNAVDIRSVTITATDDGEITFAVQVQQGASFDDRLYSDDLVRVFIDADRNQSTGVNGDEALIQFWGPSEAPTADLCYEGTAGDFACEPLVVFDVAHPSSRAFVVSGSFLYPDWFVIGVHVESLMDGDDLDLAPDDGGYVTFDLRSDQDGDGIAASGDKCPTKAGGRFDRDNDGCPGPYQTLPTPVPRFKGSASGSSLTFSRFWVVSVPKGAKVTVTAGNARFRRAGSGTVFKNRTFPIGLKMTITVSQPGSCTRQLVIRLTSSGSSPVSNRVLQPGGGIRCS